MKKKILITIFVGILASGCISQAEREREQEEKRVADSLAIVKSNLERTEKHRVDSLLIVEQRKADSIQKVNHEKEIKGSIKIINYYLSSPNSAGGVDAYFRFTNLNDKVIKYLTWEGYPINAVGDPVSCTIRRYSTYRGQNTGPFKKGQSSGYGYWDCAWYNYQAKKLILTGVDIEYMDGSNYVLKEMIYILLEKNGNSIAYLKFLVKNFNNLSE